MLRVQEDEIDAANALAGDHIEFNQHTLKGFSSQTTFSDTEALSLTDAHAPANNNTKAGNDMADSPEVYPDIALSYINHILMEEDLDDQSFFPAEHPALIAAEKPFYDVLDEYNNSIDGTQTSDFSTLIDEVACGGVEGNSFVSDFSSISVDAASPLSFDSFSSVGNSVGGMDGYVGTGARFLDQFVVGKSVEQFNKDLKDETRSLPGNGQVISDLEIGNPYVSRGGESGGKLAEVAAVVEDHSISEGQRGRKNLRGNDLDLEGNRSAKMFAASSGEEGLSKMFNDMLRLCIDSSGCGDGEAAAWFRKQVKSKAKISGGVKSRGKKKQAEMEVVDLGTMLLQSSQSVSTVDYRAVKEQLQIIRQHSSVKGDGSQRLAYFFLNGLEARLAGTGGFRICDQSDSTKRSTTAADILKAYHLYMGVSPFKRISHFFANQSILNAAAEATKIHIIDFGIGFGFQWPCLFRRVSRKKGARPKVRITGIDLPQPGFRPREQLEETGRRLADCAQSFNIPFEYCAIASKWEDIQVEDLNILEGEVVIVNCLYSLRILADETVTVESPRNIFLNTIGRVNPHLFVVGVMSSACGSPFFVTRFREALFYYSALFDVLENNVTRDDPYRLLIEREILGREAMNIIACEGSDRVYRPETYKQWRARNQQAGFKQLPLHADIFKIAKHSMVSSYDQNFMVEEDSDWMLLGWKGRVLYALSTWKPARSGAPI